MSVASGLALAGVGSATFGVPLALAAFVGGLAVTESPEAAEARRRLLPFRDLFAVLFFVAIGTLIEPDALVRGIGWLGLFLVLIVVAKVAVATASPAPPACRPGPLQLAIGLGQVGEFSFVLGSAAVAAGRSPTSVRRARRRGRTEHRAEHGPRPRRGPRSRAGRACAQSGQILAHRLLGSRQANRGVGSRGSVDRHRLTPS